MAMKLVSPSKEHLEKHYEDLADKPFYKGLVTCELAPRVFTCWRHEAIGADGNDRYAEWPHLRHGVGRQRGGEDGTK